MALSLQTKIEKEKGKAPAANKDLEPEENPAEESPAK